MLSKNQIKFIKLLKQKKQRLKHKLFVAEGIKTITELLNSKFELYHLYSTTLNFDVSDVLYTKISLADLKQISFLKTPNTALALFKIPESNNEIDFNQLCVGLDNIRDPGNLGTIIRLCDWFGVKDLVCNYETVDCYSPKVVQATMGSIARVNLYYCDLEKMCSQSNNVIGAFMSGKNVYEEILPKKGILILGNEANGISNRIEKQVNQKLSIPRFGEIQKTESLNVANAAAILLSEFKRRTIEK